MAFLKTKIAKGRHYYALAESYRNEIGQPRQRILCNLGSAKNAIKFLNCSDNGLTVKEYFDFLNKIATDGVCCPKCKSDNVIWFPIVYHWPRYNCSNGCHYMWWHDNGEIFEYMDYGLNERAKMERWNNDKALLAYLK